MNGRTGRAVLPDDVRRFVLTSVPSVPYLEALLIFRAAAGSLHARALASRLYVPESTAAALIEQLAAAGILAASIAGAGDYRYAPGSAELDVLLGRLAECYAAHLLDVTQLIHSNTERKAHQFAEAFKLRKDR